MNDLLHAVIQSMNPREASRFRAVLAAELPGFIEQAAQAARMDPDSAPGEVTISNGQPGPGEEK